MNIPHDLSAYLFLQSIVLVMVYIFMYKVLDFRFFVRNVIQKSGFPIHAWKNLLMTNHTTYRLYVKCV